MSDSAADFVEKQRMARLINDQQAEITLQQKQLMEKDLELTRLRDDLASAQNNAMADARTRDFADMVPRTEMNQKVIDAVSASRKRWAMSDRIFDGYILVPVDPTKAMKEAGVEYMREGGPFISKSARGVYSAMVLASPGQPPTVELPTVLLPKDTDKITKV